MTYLEKLLADRETVIIKAHRHILFVILHMIPYVLLSLLLWTLSGIVQVYMDGTWRNIGLIALLAISLYPLGKAIYKFLLWRREEYYVTNLRIIQIEGLMRKRTLDSGLEKVNDIQLEQSIFGRLFDYGDLEVLTGSDIGVNQLWGIAHPFEFKKALLEAKVRLSHGDGESIAARPAADDGVEAARLLAALTDLRDSGVISAEEYDQRRRQLLRQA
jgi:uncharacterized membrane protein YdbT with pleckstrin-like domain